MGAGRGFTCRERSSLARSPDMWRRISPPPASMARFISMMPSKRPALDAFGEAVGDAETAVAAVAADFEAEIGAGIAAGAVFAEGDAPNAADAARVMRI